VGRTVEPLVRVAGVLTALGTSHVKFKKFTTPFCYLGEALVAETLLLIKLSINHKIGF
jgi:hypothetical protein